MIIFLIFFYLLTAGIGADAFVLCMSHVMGMYLTSTVLLMRMNLPEKYREILTGICRYKTSTDHKF